MKKLYQRWEKGVFYRFEMITGVVFMLLLIPTLRAISAENDINIFYGAARRLRDLQNMYLGPYLYGMWYYYSPLFASVLVPFTFFSIMVIKLVWHFIGFFLIFRIYYLINWFISIPKNRNGIFFILLICITSFHSVFLNLLYGQMTILVLWCCMEGIYRAHKNQYLRSAFSFGIATNIKVLPVFFFYHFLLKKNI
ncbi:MAG: glycosyltransferase family 87 protein, partial [Bacteroidia bacterium]